MTVHAIRDVFSYFVDKTQIAILENVIYPEDEEISNGGFEAGTPSTDWTTVLDTGITIDMTTGKQFTGLNSANFNPL